MTTQDKHLAALWLVNAGLLLVAAGTLLPLLHVSADIWRYIYAAGALAAFVGRLFTPAPKEASLRIRRLARLQTWSALLFCVAVFFMFYKGAGPLDWLAFTLAGGVIQAYTSIMGLRTGSKKDA